MTLWKVGLCFLAWFVALPSLGAEKTENSREADPPLELDEPFVMPEGLDELSEQASSDDTEDLDKFEFRWGGKLQTDLRFQLQPKSAGVFYDNTDHTFYSRDDIATGVRRNENILKLKLDALYGQYAGVVDVDFVLLGYPENIEGIGDLSLNDRTSPYYIQANALYIEATDIILDGLDLRIGQQLVQWGKADQFNPTNNLNANDLEDILMFGEQRANMMVRLDYNPWSSLVLSGVLVPVFKPALLPRSASLGLLMNDRMPFVSSGLRYRMHYEKAFAQRPKDLLPTRYPTVTSSVEPQLPDLSLGNMQFAFRLAYTLLGQDIAISYYRGRHDLPQAVGNHTVLVGDEFCARDDPEDCVNGLLQTTAQVAYPKEQVLGWNMAGEIPLNWISSSLGGIGYRFELGLYFPQELRAKLTQDEIDMGLIVQPAGEYDYDNDGRPGGPRPIVLENTPFAKWTLGFDYSFGSHVMANLMWVHGFPDEFGAGDFFQDGWAVRQGGVIVNDESKFEQCAIFEGTASCGPRYANEVIRPRLGDYAILGLDFKFADDRALLRLFAILDLGPYYRDYYDDMQGTRVRRYLKIFGDGFSAILFPEFDYNFGNGFEMGIGGLIQMGKNYTKFGDPAASGTFVWTRARYSY